MRNEGLSRYYIQTPVDDPLEKWSDQAFWDELRRRLPADVAETMETGPPSKTPARIRDRTWARD
ncbi:MAG: hypothetical protein AAFQ50_09285 [Pseudomonadota bacterium]